MVKYDEAAFYNGVDFINIRLEELIEELSKDSDNHVYEKVYHNNLYCPECHVARLTLVQNRFLRGYPNSPHLNTCYNGFDLINAHRFDDFAMNETNYDFLHRKLQSAISKLFRNVNHLNPFLIKIEDNQCLNHEVTEDNLRNERNTIKQIPSKSITAPFNSDDFNIFKLFYGHVDISLKKIEKKDKSFFFKLSLYKIGDNNHELCGLNMNENVAKHIKENYNLILDEMYTGYISFVTIMKKNGKFKNANLSHSLLCCIEVE